MALMVYFAMWSMPLDSWQGVGRSRQKTHNLPIISKLYLLFDSVAVSNISLSTCLDIHPGNRSLSDVSRGRQCSFLQAYQPCSMTKCSQQHSTNS